MRNGGPFTQYNRAIVKSLATQKSQSLLGSFAAMEYGFIKYLVEMSVADATTYCAGQK